MTDVNPSTCMRKDPKDMDVKEIQSCINNLMFDETWREKLQADDKEQMNIIVLRKKASHFKFLTGYTKWKSVGTWRKFDKKGRLVEEYPDEDNYCLEVEFKDREDEEVGKRLIDLFKEYNTKAVGESVLYVFTQDIEESTLD